MKQRPCFFKSFFLVPVPAIVVRRALGYFCQRYVKLTDFSPDCLTKDDAVERASLSLRARFHWRHSWLRQILSNEFLALSCFNFTVKGP